jgi:Tfp pilus assembly protein PilX
MKPRISPPQQHGIALPVMLIILVVMLISSIYLLKSSNSTTLTASNLAYDSAQSRAVDFGLHEGYQWLNTTALSQKPLLNRHSSANGYHANYDTTWNVRSTAFWSGSRTVTLGNQTVEYVIHRMCSGELAFNEGGNRCVLTTANPFARGGAVLPGDSQAGDAPAFNALPRLHYTITARIAGARGGNVVNQMVVLIGA